MKTTSLIFLALVPLTLFAGEVKTGDNLNRVLSTLGEPRGRAQAGGRELLCFDRGVVELTSGVVTRVALRSEEAQTAFETQRTATESRVREEQEIRRIKLTAEGEAVKAAKLADKAFQSAPVETQLAYWRIFAVQYPTVSCTEQLNLVRAQFYAQERTEQIQAEEAQRAAAFKDNESSQRIFYPIYSTDSYGYGRQYSVLRRQERLDRDYHYRVSGSDRMKQEDFCQDDRTRRFQPSHHDRSRDQANMRDCRPDTRTTNNTLLAAGQDVMAWDGTKMPGGEAAGLFR